MAQLEICTVDDVARYLRTSAPSDHTLLEPYLDDAQDYVRRVTKLDFNAEGDPVEQTFYDVREQSRLRLNDLNPSNVQAVVTLIANTLPPFMPPWILSEGNDFVVEEERWIRITSSMFFRVVGFDYAYGKRSPVTWDRVQVTYVASGIIPPSLKEATALIAAAFYQQAPYDVSSLNSERLGDYSYQRNAHDPLAAIIPQKARAKLRLYRGTKSRST